MPETEERSSRFWSTRGPGYLLDLIRSTPEWTKTQLVRASGLARTTVAERLEILEQAGYVVTNRAPTLTGGRPAETTSFNADGGFILVADIGGSHTRLGIANMVGTLVAITEADIDTHSGPDSVFGFVLTELGRLVQQQGIDPARIHGIGLGVPGPVDLKTGRLYRPRTMPGWENASVAEFFAADYPGVPVFVDKDANIMALGESRLDPSARDNMVLVKAGMGIGCGIIVDGRVLHGATGAAGDIGHIPRGGDVLCSCGQYGCIDAVASGRSIAAKLVSEGRDVRTSRDIVNLVRENDPRAVELVRQAGREIGEVLALTLSIINPSLVVVSGNLAESPQPLLAGIREVVYSSSHLDLTSALQIVPSQIGTDAGIAGAAQLVLDAILDPQAVDDAIAGGKTWPQ